MEALRHHTVTNNFVEEVKRIIGNDISLFGIIQQLLLVMNSTIEIPINELIDYLLSYNTIQIDIDIPNDLISIIKSYLDYKCIVVHGQPIRFQLSCIVKLMCYYNIEVPSIYDFVHNNIIHTILISKKYIHTENATINVENCDIFRSFYLTNEESKLTVKFCNMH